jgi:hypothetical protein
MLCRVFLREDDTDSQKLLFVYSIVPYTVVSCHKTSGCCQQRQQAPTGTTNVSYRRAQLQSELSGYRGGSPVAAIGDRRTIAMV